LSPLTKLFVALLVVLSLILSAATIVFVNQTEDFKKTNQLLTDQMTAAKNQANSAAADRDAIKQNSEANIRQANAQVEAAAASLRTLQGDLASKNTDLARAKAQFELQGVSVTTLTATLKSSEDTRSHLQEQVNDLRSNSDKLVAQNAQLNQTVTDLTNRLDVTERERRLLAEQLTESKGQVERQSSMLRDAGVTSAQMASSAGTGIGAPPINGVIRDVRPIQGILYGVISVGSAEAVSPGMEFKVVSRDGTFLGVLKVDRVEQNESTGRLEGPRANEIRPGAEVKTQL
jgi:hypothetical protein